MRQPFFSFTHTHTHFLFIGSSEGKLLLLGRRRKGCELSICFEHFCIMSQVEAINKPTTGTLSPQKTRTKQPQDAGKTLSLHGATGRHFVVCSALPALLVLRLLTVCCCCCLLCKRKMTNELVIDNNRKQKVSLAAKFPLTIAKKK